MLGGGSWPGGYASWGTDRVWLEPSLNNDMRGRNNLSIHGGTNPDSKGCSRLNENMPDFIKWFVNNKDVIIKVKY